MPDWNLHHGHPDLRIEKAADLTRLLGRVPAGVTAIIVGGRPGHPLVLHGGPGWPSRVRIIDGAIVTINGGAGYFETLVTEGCVLRANRCGSVHALLGGEVTAEGCTVTADREARVIATACRVFARGASVVVLADPLTTPRGQASRGTASGHAHVTARGQTTVDVEAGTTSATIELHDQALVRPGPGFRGIIRAHDDSEVDWRGAHGEDFTLELFERARAVLNLSKGRARVIARGTSQIVVERGPVTLELHEDAQASVVETCEVEAFERAVVETWGNPIVRLHDQARRLEARAPVAAEP